MLLVQYQIQQSNDNIVWNEQTHSPIVKENRRQDELWKHSCFELFVASANSHCYREFNFSPSGQWNSYDFEAYRQKQTLAHIHQPPRIQFIEQDTNLYLLTVTLLLADIGKVPGSFDLGITAVIEYEDKTLDYYALNHCSRQADFHVRDSFSLALTLG